MQRNSNSNTLRQLFREWNRAILVVLATLGLAICCTNGSAQTLSGLSTIQGTVADSTGAVIRGATIHIVNKDTQAATDAKSNDVGFYQAPGLIAGAYTISVSAPSMKTYVYSVELLATQTAVVNPVLSAGAVTQQVTVSASIVQLTDPTSGAITSTLDNDQINHIPMNGREISVLVQYTTPGLETGFGGGGTRMNGLVNEAMVYTEDGAPTQDRDFGGWNGANQAGFADADSIQEVRVEASGSSAQYGFPATAIITTKSGTNQIHGSGFYTGRNNTVAGVAAGRANSRPFNPPNLKRDEYGISAGGPVIIPGLYHGKDKTFWFFGYEEFKYIYSTLQTAATDTETMKGGDFSGLNTVQLYDPSTTTNNAACPTPGVVGGKTVWNGGTPVANQFCRTPFGNGTLGDPGNNQIPATRRNALAKVVYDGQIPANVPGVVNPRLQANENWNAPNHENVPSISWRLDHNFNESNKAYLRYSSNVQVWQYYGGSLGTIAADGIPALTIGTETIAPVTNYTAAAGYTHVFSPKFFSETILSGEWMRDIGGNTGDIHHNYEAQLGLPNNFGDTGMPAFGGSIQSHNGGQFGYGIGETNFTLSENLTRQLSKHQLLFGGQYVREKLHYQPDISGESESADALSTALANPSSSGYGAYGNTGDSAADFFLGSLASMSTNLNERVVPYSDQVAALYIQDNYHIRRNLTVNFGLRWEDHPAMDSGGVGVGTDLPNHAIVLESPVSAYIASGRTTQTIITAYQNAGAVYETPQQAGFPSKMLRSYPLVFDPHVGFSWQPLGTNLGTILSGSYGRYSFPEAMRNLLGLSRSAPFIGGFSYNNNNPGQDPDGITNYEIRNPQNIFMGVNTPSSLVPVTGTNFVLPGSIGGGYNPDFPPIYVQEVNVSIEQPFKDQSALRVTYNYTRTTNLTHNFNINGGLSAFDYENTYGVNPPTGGASTYGTCQYQNTALQPYDCKWFGGFGINNRNGWSNYNALQVNYHRIFHRGLSYQVTYAFSREMRIGGNSTRESLDYSYNHYLGALGTAPGVSYAPPAAGNAITAPATPPPPPTGAQPWTDYQALNRFQDYKIEPYFTQPFHHIWINGIYDLPFGQGKLLLSNANRFVDEIVGGWQVAGVGQVISTGFAPAASNWGPNSPIQMYKHSVQVQDCSGGAGTSKCVNRYLWFNGYISPKLLTAANGGTCTTTSNPGCITGLPGSYVPYQTPINNNPADATNFGTNNVNIWGGSLIAKGAPATAANPLTGVAFAPDSSQSYAGNNLYSKTYLHGPFNYNADLSVFKVFPIREKMNLRVNLDAFNAFNIQGWVAPNGTSGEESFMPGGVDGNGSYWTPRQLQLTMRFSW